MPTRIFVTGGAGFFGRHLLRALVAAGHEVTALTRALPPPLPGVRWVQGDLTRFDPLPLAGHQVCIHNALVWGEPEHDLQLLDLRATAHVFAAAAGAGVERLIYTSSTAVHRPWRLRMTAEDAIGGTDLYGATKAGGEALLSAFCHEQGLSGAIVRPGPIVEAPLGPGFRLDRRTQHLIAAAIRNDDLPIAPGEGRQFIGAAELANLYVALLDRPRGLERFVAVAPRVIPWAEVAAQVVAAVGRGRVVLTDPHIEPAVFDVEATERALGPIADAGPALTRALAWAARFARAHPGQ